MTVHWRKSSRSDGVEDHACVEMARFPAGVGVRDSKNPGLGHLVLTPAAFAGLIARIRRGDLDH